MSDDRKVLDLDELFGQARAVKVKWQDQEYELLKMEAISPKDAVQFQKLQIAAGKLQMKDDMDDASAKQIEKLIDDMLKLLCKELPLQDMKFMVKMRVLTYYIEETQGKKALETALSKVTGVKSSAS
jgi:hypothetical protein